MPGIFEFERKTTGCATAGKLVVVGVAFATLLSASAAMAQSKAKVRGAQSKAPDVIIPAPLVPPAEVMPPPPRPLTPEEMPPVAPQITWNGEELTISANNSKLSSILEAVREMTGAEIDIPANAASERVVGVIGPGSARDVLSTLLSGTDFNYIIQAADDNALGVQSIVLTQRTKNGAKPNDPSPVNDIRAARMASAPRRDGFGFHRYQETTPAPAETTDTAENPTPAAENSASSASPAPAATEQPATSAQTAKPDATPAVAAAQPSAQSNAQPNAQPANDSGNVQAAASTPPPDKTDTAQLTPFQQKIADMQSMFEQRRQMQEQASRPTPPNSN